MTIKELRAGESQNIEYKQDIPSSSNKYMKTVVAFANGSGGKLIFGIENDTWAVKGFAKGEVFQKMDAITNAIYDSCEPKIMPNIAIQDIDDKSIIVVEIPAGMERPYYIKKLGITEGTFVRVSGTTRHAERYMLQELILDSSNRSFDQQETNGMVTEEQIQDFCDKLYKHSLSLCNNEEDKAQLQKITKNQLLSWKLLVEKDSQYHPTNGYLLLDGNSDKFSEATIQCAVFKGTVRDIFITRKEFGGSIYQQIEDAYNFILQHINLGSRIEGLYRQDIYELPIKTIREIIANAVCHRSYLTPGKIQVALFDNRLEVTSPGMLDNEITIEKMKTGLSKIRNKGIATAFSYLNIIEAWGSGIPRMFQETKRYGLQEPELIDMGNDFRVNLYRKNPNVDQYGVVKDTLNDTLPKKNDTLNDTLTKTNDTLNDTINEEQDSDDSKMLNIIRVNPTITQKELTKKLNVSIITVKRIMADLQKHGIIEREGAKRNGKWIIVKEK